MAIKRFHYGLVELQNFVCDSMQWFVLTTQGFEPKKNNIADNHFQFHFFSWLKLFIYLFIYFGSNLLLFYILKMFWWVIRSCKWNCVHLKCHVAVKWTHVSSHDLRSKLHLRKRQTLFYTCFTHNICVVTCNICTLSAFALCYILYDVGKP